MATLSSSLVSVAVLTLTLAMFVFPSNGQNCTIFLRGVSYINMVYHCIAGIDLGAGTSFSGEVVKITAPTTCICNIVIGNHSGNFTLYDAKTEALKCGASGGLQWQADDNGLSELQGSKFVLRYRWVK